MKFNKFLMFFEVTFYLTLPLFIKFLIIGFISMNKQPDTISGILAILTWIICYLALFYRIVYGCEKYFKNANL